MPSTNCKVCRTITGSYLFKYCSFECQETDKSPAEKKEEKELNAQFIEIMKRAEELLKENG